MNIISNIDNNFFEKLYIDRNIIPNLDNNVKMLLPKLYLIIFNNFMNILCLFQNYNSKKITFEFVEMRKIT